MGVKSIFKASIALLCAFLFVTEMQSLNSYNDQHIEVSLRKIGHEFLLKVGDSTSRVLPISRELNQYKMRFDANFGFDPDDLVKAVNSVMLTSEISDSFIVRVEECATSDVVYSYEVSDLDSINNSVCSGRSLPVSCYNIIFTLHESDEADVAILTDSGDNSQASNDLPKYILIIALIMALAGSIFYSWKRRKRDTIDPNLIPLGAYHFDKRNTELLIEDQRIELSSKEADLLLLLYNTVNITVEREVILNRVWGDEGDYVGRTLDVFISKLRKKLEGDSNVKIVNIRGVGYKLVANV